MMSKDEWDAAARVLIKLTRNEGLTWKIENAIAKSRENVVGNIYTTNFESKKIAVYEYRFQYYVSEDEYLWRNDVAIEFIALSDTVEWQWPQVESRWELLEAIRYKNSRAEDFLKSLLSKK